MIAFYTYLWLREDGTPYYVGKGHGKRAFRKGSPPRERVIIQEWPSEADAFAAESFLIVYYGRKDIGTGILRNMTDGGEGTFGRKQSESTRHKKSESLKGNQCAVGYHHTQTAIDKITKAQTGAGNWAFGIHLSEEHRRNIGRGQEGRVFSQETRAKLSEKAKQREELRRQSKKPWAVGPEIE